MTDPSTRTAGRGALRAALVAYGVFAVTEMLAWVVVLLWAFDRGGAWLAGVAATVQLLPAVPMAVLGSAWVDRTTRRRAVAGSYALNGCALVATAALVAGEAPVPGVLAAATVATGACALSRPAHFAAVPQLVDDARAVRAANAGSTVLGAAGLCLGPVLATLGHVVIGSAATLLAGGAALLAGAAAVRLTCPHLVAVRLSRPGGPLEELLRGVRVVVRDPGVAALVAGTVLLAAAAGALDVLAVAFAADRLGGSDVGGLLVAGVGLGCVGGAVALVRLRRQRLGATAAAGIALGGLPLLLLPVVPGLGPALALVALSGAGLAAFQVAGRTLLQQTAAPHVLGRVLGVEEAVRTAGLMVGAALAPVLVAVLGPARAVVPLGVVLPVAALVVLRGLRRLDARAVQRPVRIARLDAVPFLAALDRSTVEALAAVAREVSAEPGDVVVREGEPGDTFYVVLSGRLVARTGCAEQPIGPQDFFGEIALVRPVPRTADVVAVTPVRLLALSRDEFELTVGRTAAALAATEAVVRTRLARMPSASANEVRVPTRPGGSTV